MKQKSFVLMAIAFQILTVGYIAISKEWILVNGDDIILQTAPIDPRDIFRGDYVRLDYAISTVAVEKLEAGMLEHGMKKGRKVYMSLTINEHGIAEGRHLYSAPPANNVYLKGHVKSHWPYRNYDKRKEANKKEKITRPVPVKYGIEQYYVEQGHGRDMEKTRGNRNSFQVPMLMRLAVSDSGEALIRSFDWANIAMKTEIKQSPKTNAPDEEASAIMSFTLLNRGEQALELPLKPGNCSFAIIPIESTPDAGQMSFDRSGCVEKVSVIKILQPNEELSIDFNLNSPHWYVHYKNEQRPMGQLPWNYRFRIIYQGDELKGVNADIISRAFHGRGNID